VHFLRIWLKKGAAGRITGYIKRSRLTFAAYSQRVKLMSFDICGIQALAFLDIQFETDILCAWKCLNETILFYGARPNIHI
jgi:hypothetical protein